MLRTLALCLIALALPLQAAEKTAANGKSMVDLSWWPGAQSEQNSLGLIDANGDGRISQNELAMARIHFAAALKDTQKSLLAAVDLDQSGAMGRFQDSESAARIMNLRQRAVELARATSGRKGTATMPAADEINIRLVKILRLYGVKSTNADNAIPEAMEPAISAVKSGTGALFAKCDITNDGHLSIKEIAMAFDLMAAAAGINRS